MTSNIGNKQDVIYQNLQKNIETGKEDRGIFSNVNIKLIENSHQSLIKEQSAQRLHHLLNSRFPNASPQRIDALLNQSKDNFSIEALRLKQVKQL